MSIMFSFSHGRGHESARTAMRKVRRTGREILLTCGIVVGERRGALEQLVQAMGRESV